MSTISDAEKIVLNLPPRERGEFAAKLIASLRSFDEAAIGEAISRGMVARRILDGIVRNVYKSNTGKIAAWTSASHIERDAKPKEPPTA